MKFSEDLDKGLVKFVSSYDFLRAFFGTRQLIKAEVLTYLIQLSKHLEANNEFFWVTHNYMVNRLGYERHAISRTYRALEQQNFIECKAESNGTYVKVNMKAIESQYLKFKEQELKKLKTCDSDGTSGSIDGTPDTVGMVLQVPSGGTSDYSNKCKLNGELNVKEMDIYRAEPYTASNEAALFKSQEITKEDLTKVIDNLLMYALDRFPNTNNEGTIKYVRDVLKDIYLEKGYDFAIEKINAAERFLFIGKEKDNGKML